MYNCNNRGTCHSHAVIREIEACWGSVNPVIWVTAVAPLATDYPMSPASPVPVPPGSKLARYDSVCNRCRMPIKVGASIQPDGNGRWICAPSCAPAVLPGPTSPSVVPTPSPAIATRKSMFEGPFLELLEHVPDGNFAVREEEGAPITFLRVSRPKTGKYMDCIKVQTQHSEVYEIRWVRWPSGRISIYSGTIEEDMLLLITSYRESARLYAKEIGKCARCNTALTDDRSRYFGIGPECEKHWLWMVQERLTEATEAGEVLPRFAK